MHEFGATREQFGDVAIEIKPLPRGSAKVRLADALGVKELTGEEGDQA